MASRIQVLQLLCCGCIGFSICFLIMAVCLFFYCDIRHVWEYLTGRAGKRELPGLRRRYEHEGKNKKQEKLDKEERKRQEKLDREERKRQEKLDKEERKRQEKLDKEERKKQGKLEKEKQKKRGRK